MEEINQDENNGGTKQWLQDNLRIIISIIIVIAIAGGIYSYSKRTQLTPAPKEAQEAQLTSEEGVTGESTIEGTTTEENKDAEVKTPEQPKTPTEPTVASQETEKSFIETASKGEGRTHLARRSLANYLEKNPDSNLTAEHKIYIEDYLRKKAGNQGRVFVGAKIEFSKDLIQEAIGKAKQLNEKQLKNLHKYAVKVPSLS